MEDGSASRKREARVRTPEGVKSLPVNIKNELSTETIEYGYENEWRCMVYAASIGLRIMRKMRDRATEIVNKAEQLTT